MNHAIDRTGQVFGELTVVSRETNDKHNKAQWLCTCTCGQQTIVGSNALVKGNTRSCGHLRRATIHGMEGTRTYTSWESMIQRCTNPRTYSYRNYGARGISVCAEWREFATFYRDMGTRPDGRTLDRIDNEGNYEASNCRWATPSEQAKNKRKKIS